MEHSAQPDKRKISLIGVSIYDLIDIMLIIEHGSLVGLKCNSDKCKGGERGHSYLGERYGLSRDDPYQIIYFFQCVGCDTVNGYVILKRGNPSDWIQQNYIKKVNGEL